MIKDLVTVTLEPTLFKAPASNPQGGSQGFEQFMTEIEARNRDTAPEPERSRDREGREVPVQQRPRDPEQEQAPVAEIAPEAEVTYIADDTAEVVEESDEYEEIEEVIVVGLAEALVIPAELVYEQLEELEIQPKELAEPPVANKYLQKLLEVESPVELLTMPEYQDALKEVAEVISEVLESETPTEAAKPNFDKLKGLVATVDDQNRVVVTQVQETAEIMPAVEEEGLFQLTEEEVEIGSPRDSQDRQVAQASYAEAAPVAVEAPEVLLQDSQQANISAVNPAISLAAQAAEIFSTTQIAAQTSVEPAQVMEQIISQVRTVSAENFAELRMTLRPEHLGDVSLRVTVQNGIVMAMFVAESQRVKEIIEQNFNVLRDALEEQGIEVAELFVSVSGGEAESQAELMNQYLKAQQEAMRRLQRAGGSGEAEEEEAIEEILIDNTVSFTA